MRVDEHRAAGCLALEVSRVVGQRSGDHDGYGAPDAGVRLAAQYRREIHSSGL